MRLERGVELGLGEGGSRKHRDGKRGKQRHLGHGSSPEREAIRVLARLRVGSATGKWQFVDNAQNGGPRA
ncbi:hypothetical protein GCM10007913_12480 [Devosia yakushimensis]|uniref:Uncharacterized protein n=1 Tax=Devosia yakushimensis TaxID=470028 RepID=A0ABQ5UBU2_9HYPH|nr:hypothetical protein GCM10007913_12480 [Devosia yakushimensis]